MKIISLDTLCNDETIMACISYMRWLILSKHQRIMILLKVLLSFTSYMHIYIYNISTSYCRTCTVIYKEAIPFLNPKEAATSITTHACFSHNRKGGEFLCYGKCYLQVAIDYRLPEDNDESLGGHITSEQVI